MSKNIMTSGIEMEDVIKPTGFPVPEDMVGKTFAEVVEGGGSGDITVEALTATENKVYTAPEGKAYSPVTVNVPTSNKLYAWVSGDIAINDYKELSVAPADLTAFKSSKRIEVDANLNLHATTEEAYSRHTNITSYVRTSDTSFTIIDDGDEYTYTRDTTKDVTLW